MAPRPQPTTAPRATKGEGTRTAIVHSALKLAASIGLESVSLGVLANQLELSKSGLFAHFKSKEALQLAVMEEAAERFSQRVILPAMAQPRGEPRVRALFSNQLDWSQNNGFGEGCFFVSLAQEYDDQPGPIRDRVVQQEVDWRGFISKAVTLAIQEGHFASTVDPLQFAFEFVSLSHGFQQATKLLHDPNARTFALRAFDRLIAEARSKKKARA